MTAGRGISHAEMVGLRNGEAENEGMVFQIWMNLPKKSKKAPPFTKMFWREDTPVATSPGGATVRVFAGDGANDPPPDSWAADATNHVVVRLISLPPGASIDVSRASPTTTLSLYPFDFKGATLDVVDAGGRGALSLSARDELCTLGVSTPIVLKNAAASGVVQVLQLEAEPIGEPVAWHGPFGALPASVDSRARFFRPSSTRAAPPPQSQTPRGRSRRPSRPTSGAPSSTTGPGPRTASCTATRRGSTRRPRPRRATNAASSSTSPPPGPRATCPRWASRAPRVVVN